MKHDKRKTNWIIDAILFGGFLVAMWLHLTGVALHQWLGVALAGLAAVHLAVHWDWVSAVTARLFGRTGGRARLAYVVDAGVASGFLAIGLTGLIISTWLDFPVASVAGWRNVHVLASVSTLALIVVKIGLHWRWIVGVAWRIFAPAPASATFRPTAAAARLTAAQPATTSLTRRDFLRLMGGVSAMALLAGVRVLGCDSEVSADAQAPATTAGTASNAAAGTRSERTPAASSSSASSSTGSAAGSGSSCSVRCDRGCSYPGHCHRYVDSDGSGRCDLGECLS